MTDTVPFGQRINWLKGMDCHRLVCQIHKLTVGTLLQPFREKKVLPRNNISESQG